TSHPKDLSDGLIDAIAGLPKVCEHIHLAVQSGDDEILERMNRGYSSEHIRERVGALRSAVPDIAITTDFLVGFPEETDSQFENTMLLIQELRFDAAFMFAFNPIPKTAAAAMSDQISPDIKNKRLNQLIKVQNAITCEINDSCVGKTYDVLVEGISPKDPGRLTGLTRQNKTVNFPGSKDLVGRQVGVRATEGHLYGFVGVNNQSGK
ncbi:MAG: radical SAM protein, partial [Armatimonadetes bacterium]|nr:radical SAM protein [Armatimonadota bacterium]